MEHRRNRQVLPRDKKTIHGLRVYFIVRLLYFNINLFEIIATILIYIFCFYVYKNKSKLFNLINNLFQ